MVGALCSARRPIPEDDAYSAALRFGFARGCHVHVELDGVHVETIGPRKHAHLDETREK